SAQANEDRRVGDVAHGDVVKGDVLQQSAIHRFQRQAAAVIEHTIGNSDVFEAAIGFGAELDAAGWAAAAVLVVFALVGAVQESALVIAADLAIGDGEVFGGAGEAQPEGALGADAVVEG